MSNVHDEVVNDAVADVDPVVDDVDDGDVDVVDVAFDLFVAAVVFVYRLVRPHLYALLSCIWFFEHICVPWLGSNQ